MKMLSLLWLGLAQCLVSPLHAADPLPCAKQELEVPQGLLKPPPPAGQVIEGACEDWARIEIDHRYALINNVWNKQAAKGPSLQRVFGSQREGRTALGWQWSWGSGDKVVAYPEVVVGDKPWDAPSGLPSEFPFAAGSRKLFADFDVALEARGTYNMAFSLWGVADPARPKASISHEVMIWTVNHEMYPAGPRQDTLTVEGREFTVHVRKQHSDQSGGSAAKWDYIAFVAREPMLKGSLNLGAFIDYLLAKGLMTRETQLTSVEFGNEVVEGAGRVEISDYRIRVE